MKLVHIIGADGTGKSTTCLELENVLHSSHAHDLYRSNPSLHDFIGIYQLPDNEVVAIISQGDLEQIIKEHIVELEKELNVLSLSFPDLDYLVLTSRSKGAGYCFVRNLCDTKIVGTKRLASVNYFPFRTNKLTLNNNTEMDQKKLFAKFIWEASK